MNTNTIYRPDIVAFVRESNRIEGIRRDPTVAEMEECLRFLAQDEITVNDMIQFVSVYQPDAALRDQKGMNVMVGGYLPPRGDITIKTRLMDILADAKVGKSLPEYSQEAYRVHQNYEHLHPFMDGNGRSGRMLWLWMMGEAPLGFLHTWYYQSLAAGE